MTDTITVKAGPKVEAGRVAIWERDDAHPGGELYIAKAHEGGTDEAVEAAETSGVIAALADGRLARAERRRPAPPVPEPAPAATGASAGATSGEAIPGVTPQQLQALQAAGFHTPADIRAASDDDLAKVEGIGPATVARLREATKE